MHTKFTKAYQVQNACSYACRHCIDLNRSRALPAAQGVSVAALEGLQPAQAQNGAWGPVQVHEGERSLLSLSVDA